MLNRKLNIIYNIYNRKQSEGKDGESGRNRNCGGSEKLMNKRANIRAGRGGKTSCIRHSTDSAARYMIIPLFSTKSVRLTRLFLIRM